MTATQRKELLQEATWLQDEMSLAQDVEWRAFLFGLWRSLMDRVEASRG